MTFCSPGQYFEPTGKVSKGKLNALVDALKAARRPAAGFRSTALFLAGVTQDAGD